MGPDAGAGAEDDLVVVPARPLRPVQRRSRLRAGLRWCLAVTALVLVGAGAAVTGWRSLSGGAVEGPPEARPGPQCVARAVEDARAFAAVLGDPRPVDRRALEHSCVGRP